MKSLVVYRAAVSVSNVEMFLNDIVLSVNRSDVEMFCIGSVVTNEALLTPSIFCIVSISVDENLFCSKLFCPLNIDAGSKLLLSSVFTVKSVYCLEIVSKLHF